MAEHCCTVQVRCHNLEATARFLQLIGFKGATSTGTETRLEYGGLAIELIWTDDAPQCRGICISIPVGEELDALTTQIKGAGVSGRFSRDDHGSPFAAFVVTAPNGLEIALSGITLAS